MYHLSTTNAKSWYTWIPTPARQPARLSRHLILTVAIVLVGVIYLLRSHGPDLTSLPQNVISFPFRQPAPTAPRVLVEPSEEIIRFWDLVATELVRAKPNSSTISPPVNPVRPIFDPKAPNPNLHFDILRITEEQEESLRVNHALFVQSIKDQLAPALPYEKSTKGIVMTADITYLGVAMTSLLMLRRTGSKLPAQIFLDSTDEKGRQRCDAAVAALDAHCVNLDSFMKLDENSTAKAHADDFKLTKYQFKVFALLFSSYQEILFLDADAFPLYSPDALLKNEPYRSHGLVTWPDFWIPTVSKYFWKVAGVENPPEVDLSCRASESGIMLYDKGRHAESLLLATYYNFYGPDMYYPLMSQGAWGQGDKETFYLAAKILGKPAWNVKTPAEMLSSEMVHEGSGIRQVDPQHDYIIYLRKQEEKERKEKEEKEKKEKEQAEGETKSAESKDSAKPTKQSRVIVKNKDMSRTVQKERADKEGLGEIKSPKWMFAHLNRVKIDARRVNASVGHIIYKPFNDGKLGRLWGHDKGTIVGAAGFDVEKAVWDEILQANCQNSLLEECERLREYVATVFTE